MASVRFGLLLLLFLSRIVAENSALGLHKDEAVAKADKIFGQPYTPVAGKTMRLYEEQTETGPRDELIYWHGSTYVIELIFAADGTVARIVLLPEALLHSESWTDVPNTVELSPGEMQWLVASANAVRSLGDARANAPNLCFYSGPNRYCDDHYELATVSHYHLERVSELGLHSAALRYIAILYKQPVVGIVEDARVQGSERHLKVGGQWYHGEKPGVDIFENSQVGSVVRLATYGCTATEKACVAVPGQSKSTAVEQ